MAAGIALCATTAMADGSRSVAGAKSPCAQNYAFDFSAYMAKQQIGATSEVHLIGGTMQTAFMLEPAARQANRDGATFEARVTAGDITNAHFAVLGTDAYGLDNANRSPSYLASIKASGWVDPL